MNSNLSALTDVTNQLLTQAAAFFRQVGEQNPGLQEKLTAFAGLYDSVAEQVTKNPEEEFSLPDPENAGMELKTNALEYSAKLLADAAAFLRNVGGENPELAQQLNSNAETYDEVSGMLKTFADG